MLSLFFPPSQGKSTECVCVYLHRKERIEVEPFLCCVCIMYCMCTLSQILIGPGEGHVEGYIQGNEKGNEEHLRKVSTKLV